MRTHLKIASLLVLVAGGCRPAPPEGGPPQTASTSSPFLKVPRSAVLSRGLPPEVEKRIEAEQRQYSRLYLAAEDAVRAGRYAEAEAKCAEIEQIWLPRTGHRDSGVAYVRGRILMHEGRYRDAARMMAPNPNTSPVGRLDLALCYAKVGDVERARAFYDPSLITDYNSAFADAPSYLPEVETRAELEAALQWCRAVALSNVGRADEATDGYAAALRVFPHNALLAARLGAAAENAGRPEVAASAYAVVQRYGDPKMREATRYDLTRTAGKAQAVRALRERKPPAG